MTVVIATFRLVLAIAVLVAIAAQFRVALAQHSDVVNFFSFFTILSNLFGAAVFAYAASTAIARKAPRSLDALRGASTLYLAIVGLVFSTLLADVESDVVPWVNAIVHYVMPIAVVVDWLADPPRTPLSWRIGLAWLAFPAVYLAYTFVRGAIVGWYPYPFLDVSRVGVPTVAGYCLAIFVVTIVVGRAVIVSGDALARMRRPSEP